MSDSKCPAAGVIVLHRLMRAMALALLGTLGILSQPAFTSGPNADGDELPTIQIAAGRDVTEGEDAVFTLTRPEDASAAEIEVSVTVSEDGEVVASGDKGPKTVTFGAGETTAMLSVASVDDKANEEASTVTVTVLDDATEPATYDVGAGNSAGVSVANDDDLFVRLFFSNRVGDVDDLVPLGSEVEVNEGDTDSTAGIALEWNRASDSEVAFEGRVEFDGSADASDVINYWRLVPAGNVSLEGVARRLRTRLERPDGTWLAITGLGDRLGIWRDGIDEPAETFTLHIVPLSVTGGVPLEAVEGASLRFIIRGQQP